MSVRDTNAVSLSFESAARRRYVLILSKTELRRSCRDFVNESQENCCRPVLGSRTSGVGDF